MASGLDFFGFVLELVEFVLDAGGCVADTEESVAEAEEFVTEEGLWVRLTGQSVREFGRFVRRGGLGVRQGNEMKGWTGEWGVGLEVEFVVDAEFFGVDDFAGAVAGVVAAGAGMPPVFLSAFVAKDSYEVAFDIDVIFFFDGLEGVADVVGGGDDVVVG